MSRIRNTLVYMNRHAFLLGAIGLGALAVCNWRRLAADEEYLARQSESARPRLEIKPDLPLVSVLVAAWNEAGQIEEHIRHFLALRYPGKELVLCAGGADGTYATASRWVGPQVTVLRQEPGEGKQRALDRCLRQSRGEVIFLTDADCLLGDEPFESTLAPLLLDGEAVATGSSRPLSGQLANPLVVHQWCTDLFFEGHRPEYVNGVLGRNCAVSRQALDQIGGFGAAVSTGTDYHMAKLLLGHGYRIRHVSYSAVQTRYPETVRSYWRRQSRWVRNLLIHGPAFGAYGEAAQALRTGLVGLAMLALPFTALAIGPIMLAIWALLLSQAFLAKARHASFARRYGAVSIGARQYLLIPVHTFIDFIAWCVPLKDLLLQRNRW